ncbi:Putative virion core protein (lumpy skin disease virus) [Slackia heliotrinireducens]|uniref:Putative virion core protein (Lumpy skin disease virus) n=1 Tax=Slackia heliotrinireducens (strain ATCC 29202 / DSM 20476 / NCTC 11029 / RHS 1) TaxID=471855 RepID=C7N389_SLAHD|nr:SPFH domain-containing protein [Slackia heliotrinireducens]ACV23612.1 putative virion core protein (lumpy skin disease virus) [Slackia heliotrinireducens DSM 20476]VEH03091.1 Putative virion core protein (lumpy skin disease virus) [Slackia heliotrinireducens]
MGVIRAFTGAIGGAFADQWKDIITAGAFDEHVVVSPGILRSTSNGRGTNMYGSDGVISNGSKIYVPENTACFIFSQSGIEEIITVPGGYEYRNGQESVFNGSSFTSAIFSQAKERLGYGGMSADYKQIAFVNLREIRDIKFGTKGAQVYNDYFYGTDLEIFAYGSFTVKVTNPVTFICNFVPANVTYYTFDDQKVRSQILAEFLQSFTVALNSLSSTYRISQLPAQANAIANTVANDNDNAGTWEERFGFKLTKVAIENIEFTEQSRELVRQYSENRMRVKAYDDVSQRASNIAAQQQIAEGIRDNGLGDAGGMIFGMNMAQGLGSVAEQRPAMSFDEQIEQLKKLKELVDAGILTQEEFDVKKREIMGL